MTRKLFAALAILALASCFGRVSAWAAAPSDLHACCPGESPVITECCPVPAAAHAVKPLSSELSFIVVAAPAPAPAFAFERVEADASRPHDPRTFHSAVPARAPPLA